VSVVFAFAFLALLVVVVAGGSKPTVTWGTNPSSTLGLPYSRQRYIPALRSLFYCGIHNNAVGDNITFAFAVTHHQNLTHEQLVL
jgi:hypothetical protein